jgi:hypothetical membrane protein
VIWNKQRITWMTGLAGSGIIALSMLITALFYSGRTGEGYSPLNHFVSELGEVGISELAWLFNGGLVIGGVLVVVSMIGLALHIRGWFRYLVAAFGLLTGISGTLVGIFPMNQLDLHIAVALTFFNTGWMITGAFSLYALFGKGHHFPRWLAIPGIITAITFVAFSNYNDPYITSTESLAEILGAARPDVWGIAVLEWIVVLCILIWIALVSEAVRRFPAE